MTSQPKLLRAHNTVVVHQSNVQNGLKAKSPFDQSVIQVIHQSDEDFYGRGAGGIKLEDDA
jgi:hypothetical protein